MEGAVILLAVTFVLMVYIGGRLFRRDRPPSLWTHSNAVHPPKKPSDLFFPPK